jgi:7-carboxy-7-deazaguanine synthase
VPGLRVTEVFHSIQGESLSAGLRTAFVRLTGCPLRCGYCDTAYAFTGGEAMALATVLARVAEFEVRHVCVTGGEPLAQPACLELLRALCDAGYAVSLETSGAMDIGGVDPRVSRVLDLKTPASGECARNLWSNLGQLTPGDQIKVVICDEPDYRWAVERLHEHRLAERCPVLFSPVVPGLDPGRLADWILRDRLPVRLQLQLHKLLWGDARGR